MPLLKMCNTAVTNGEFLGAVIDHEDHERILTRTFSQSMMDERIEHKNDVMLVAKQLQ